jgi:hypothetical protein
MVTCWPPHNSRGSGDNCLRALHACMLKQTPEHPGRQTTETGLMYSAKTDRIFVLERIELHGTIPVFAEYIRPVSLVCRPGCSGVCLSMQAWSARRQLSPEPRELCGGQQVTMSHTPWISATMTTRCLIVQADKYFSFFASRLQISYSMCTVLSRLHSTCT